jgi:gliding motility-associated protein GldM
MINMMYLVLTALLALNVSAEILNAFKTVNKSLENTNTTVANSSETIMSSLQDKLNDPKNAEKAKIWYPKAQEVQKASKNVYSYIQSLKDDIIKQGGGDVYSHSFKADNLDIATRLMVDKKKGVELKKMLDDYKKNVLAIDPEMAKAFANTISINTEVPTGTSKANNTFERAYFHMVPTVAALTVLSKFQNDVKTTENKLVEWCHNQVGAVKVRFNHYVPFAATDHSYVLPGDKMNITAAIGAFSDQALPTITIDGTVQPLDAEGKALREVTAASGLGKHTVNVNIKYTDIDGNQKSVDKAIEYMVGQSAASIGLDKMNVLYIGVDNPVTVAASGIGDEGVGFSITGGGGTYTKLGGGKYTVRVNTPTNECWINVTVNGKLAGKQVFRVRNIPKPVAQVGPYESGANVPAGAFKAQAGVAAFAPNFPFDLTYKVTSFTISADDDNGYIIDACCSKQSLGRPGNKNSQ